MASLAIYGVRKYIAAAKTTEAQNSLGRIGFQAVAAFERGTTNSHGDVVQRICPSASATVPASIVSVKAKKYQSSPDEWQVDKARNAGFACLGFEITAPQYFVYKYTAHGSTKPGDTFEAEATADLSGDGTLTSFHTIGKISAAHALEITTPPKAQ
jgi:type IV pilus assembly protein PilA